MDSAELDRIAATLKAAIARPACLLPLISPSVLTCATSPDVRDIIRHAREMHDLFVEALVANEPLRTAQYRGIADSTGNAIGELEAQMAKAAGKVH